MVNISVIIPARNTATVIGQQLEALAAQIEAPPFEVIVCDNGSTDGTGAAVSGFSGAVTSRVVDASSAVGASHARNVGAVAATGNLLLFCDSDDLVDEHWVATMAWAHSQNPLAILVGALDHDRFNDVAIRQAYSIPAGSPSARRGERVVESPTAFAGYLPTAAGNNFAIQKGIYIGANGMDSSYPGGSEETDFVWRAQQAGASVLSVPGAIVNYRLRQRAVSIFRQQRIQQRSRILLWMRFRDFGMHGPSWRSSAIEVARALAVAPVTSWKRPGRLRLALRLGGHIGALQGMFIYRVLGRTPSRQLMDLTDA